MSFFIQDHANDQINTPAHPTVRTVQLHRAEVCPPALFSRSRPYWQRALRSLWVRISQRLTLWQRHEHAVPAPRPMSHLLAVRSAFLDALSDLPEDAIQTLCDRIERARSLRELWHLRADVFNLLSQHRGQTLAQARVDAINAHFPSRVPQSGRCTPDSGRTVAW